MDSYWIETLSSRRDIQRLAPGRPSAELVVDVAHPGNASIISPQSPTGFYNIDCETPLGFGFESVNPTQGAQATLGLGIKPLRGTTQ